ncbi:MAG TPA: hypothetical protein DEH78_06195 [Solibacterales bacterium]|nr:hypothetical protein [Bryobacterales bacterium]
MHTGIDNRFWFTESRQLGFQRFRYERTVSYPARLQEEYVVVLCLRGTLHVVEEGASHTLRPGDVLIGNSFQWRASEYGAQGGCEGLSLIASPPLVRRACAMPAGEAPGVAPIFRGVRDGAALKRVAEDALSELDSVHPARGELLDALGRELLIRAVRLWREPSAGQAGGARMLPRRHFVSAIDYMQTRGKSEFAVEKMCADIGLNSADFNRLFRNCTGRTPLHVYNSLLAARARQALETGEGSVKEVSYGLGFGSPSQFTSFFRRLTGHSPTECRDHARPF